MGQGLGASQGVKVAVAHSGGMWEGRAQSTVHLCDFPLLFFSIQIQIYLLLVLDQNLLHLLMHLDFHHIFSLVASGVLDKSRLCFILFF